jgi:sirohydrochlorin ferrochelatase
MTLVLVAHGTRDPAGAATAEELARRLAERTSVVLAYADVRGPNLTDVLTEVHDQVVVVPAFLAAGYHVRVDLPEQIERSGRAGVVLAAPLGPAPGVVSAAVDRLREAGWRASDDVVLAAAGSSDPRAAADVQRAAALLSEQVGGGVRIGYVATGRPSVAEVVHDRTAVVSWLLAPGVFHQWLSKSGARVVSAPIGAHPLLVDELWRRYLAAIPPDAGIPVPDSRGDNGVITSLPEVTGWDHRSVRRCTSGGWPAG